jgi:hypothetical protein
VSRIGKSIETENTLVAVELGGGKDEGDNNGYEIFLEGDEDSLELQWSLSPIHTFTSYGFIYSQSILNEKLQK